MTAAPALTVQEVAARLKVSDEAVLDLIHSRRLAAVNVGLGTQRPRWRITEESLDLFLTAQTPAPKATRRATSRSPAVIEFF